MRRVLIGAYLVIFAVACAEVPQSSPTQVWLAPVPAGDMIALATHPELWPQARARVDVLEFYQGSAYHDPKFVCGVPCGPNTFPALRDAVPGGFFRWMDEQGIELAMGSGAVKEWSCTERLLRERAIPITLTALKNVEESGGRISYITLDEPFAIGATTPKKSPFGPEITGCMLPVSEVAWLVAIYIRSVHERYPDVQVGLIEPYPHFTPDEIAALIDELRSSGVSVPFFHLDFDQPRAIREGLDMRADLQRIRSICAERSIPFGVSFTGGDGSSNEQFTVDTWAMVRNVFPILGITEHTVFQSFAESIPGDITSKKDKPDTVPETEETTHTGQLLRMLEFMSVPSVS